MYIPCKHRWKRCARHHCQGWSWKCSSFSQKRRNEQILTNIVSSSAEANSLLKRESSYFSSELSLITIIWQIYFTMLLISITSVKHPSYQLRHLFINRLIAILTVGLEQTILCQGKMAFDMKHQAFIPFKRANVQWQSRLERLFYITVCTDLTVLR